MYFTLSKDHCTKIRQMNSAQFTDMESFLFYSNGIEELGCATALLLPYNRILLHVISYVKAASELKTTYGT